VPELATNVRFVVGPQSGLGSTLFLGAYLFSRMMRLEHVYRHFIHSLGRDKSFRAASIGGFFHTVERVTDRCIYFTQNSAYEKEMVDWLELVDVETGKYEYCVQLPNQSVVRAITNPAFFGKGRLGTASLVMSKKGLMRLHAAALFFAPHREQLMQLEGAKQIHVTSPAGGPRKTGILAIDRAYRWTLVDYEMAAICTAEAETTWINFCRLVELGHPISHMVGKVGKAMVGGTNTFFRLDAERMGYPLTRKYVRDIVATPCAAFYILSTSKGGHAISTRLTWDDAKSTIVSTGYKNGKAA